MPSDRLGAKLPRPARDQIVRKAQVQSFTVGSPGVSPTLVTVLLDGDGDPVEGVGTCAHYAPTVNDWVWVLVQPGFWVILDRIG